MEIITSQPVSPEWGPYFFTALFVSAFCMYVVMTLLMAYTRPRGRSKR